MITNQELTLVNKLLLLSIVITICPSGRHCAMILIKSTRLSFGTPWPTSSPPPRQVKILSVHVYNITNSHNLLPV